jgi:DNA repair protein RecN (Recombination protein N)
MLSMLRVENLSVIESITVEFEKGLNIITGETGAGKSVFIGALNLVMGARFNRTLFRDPEKKLIVEAEFEGEFDLKPELAEQFDVSDSIIIRREIDKNGKNRIFINGCMATVEQLKELTYNFCDIHGQHEHQLLLDSSTHIAFIDSLVEPSLKDRYSHTYSRYKELESKINRIKNDREQILREKDMLEYQLNEIDSMKIDLEADSNIDDKVSMLSNMEKILDNSGKAISVLRDGEVNAYDMISSASSAVDSVSSYSGDLEKASNLLAELTYLLNDAIGYLENVADNQELDPSELDMLMDRKYKLGNLMKKYGSDLESVLEFADQTRAKLDEIHFGQDNLDNMEAELSEIESELKEDARLLNLRRREIARDIEKQVIDSLEDLELKNSVFKTDFTENGKLDKYAGIKAEFLISTNPGFDAGPISKVASGGEISRVMLSLKEVFAVADRVDTLVFDEIDTGISGRTAKRVAKKLKKVGDLRQVIVITHLPVVASGGRRHYHITKSLDGEKARTDVMLLEDDERLGVLGSMITGEDTPSARKQAEEILKDMLDA